MRRREVQGQTNDVKDIMAQNLQKVHERGQKINDVVQKTAGA